jgi:hypothetical protein
MRVRRVYEGYAPGIGVESQTMLNAGYTRDAEAGVRCQHSYSLK